MADWLEWASFGLGVVGVIGILVLVYQWFIDNHSHAPYTVSFPLGGWIPPFSRTLRMEAVIRNRRSSDGRLSAWLSIPQYLQGGGSVLTSLDKGTVASAIMGPLPRPFTIPAKAELSILVSGEVRSGTPWPSVVHIEIIDERPGKRQFQFGRDFATHAEPAARPTQAVS